MTDERWTAEIDQFIDSDLRVGQDMIERILQLLTDHQWDGRDFFGVRLALDEAVVNAIKHGNKLDPAKKVQVVCKLSAQKFHIKVADEGPGFKPECVPDCTDSEHIELPNGRGIMLMRNFMDFVEYNERGNVVIMEKTRTPAS